MGPRERHARQRAKTHALPTILVSLFGFLLIAIVAFTVGMVHNIEEWLTDLPDYTDADSYLVSEPTTILDADGNVIATFYYQNRTSITIDEVSQYVLDGTVDVEDERFYEHNGVDLIAIARAFLSQLTGGSEGGSTITQQLVRNTILSDEQFDNTIERKVREAYLAIKLEEMYTKEEILMMYLNTIYYGHGAYGIEAAAQTYFSKSASELTLAEAALLVGLPNAPSYYDPTSNPDAAIERRNKVLGNMLEQGSITQEQYDEAIATELELDVTEISGTGIDMYDHEYFVQYVLDLLEDEFSTDILFKGGLTVKTTISTEIQEAAEEAALSTISNYTEYNDGLEIGMTVIDPDTGYILAMVGGTDYYSDDYHRNHATERYLTGSTFKTFTLAAAIEAGMDPSILVNCSSSLDFDGVTVSNYGNTNYGIRTLASATAVSSNTAYVQVAEVIGNDKIIDMCERLGIDVDSSNLEDVLTLTLGTGNINTVEMATAYATLANGGYQRDAVAITEIVSRSGTIIYQYEDTAEQVVDTGVTYAVTEVLETVMTSGTGASGKPNIDQPVAGKTGTSSNLVSLWFCGYTPQLAVAIVVVKDDNTSMVNAYGGDLSNSNVTLPVFKAFMETVLADAAYESFPTGEITYLDDSTWEFRYSTTTTTTEEEEEEEEEEETEGEETTEDAATDTSTDTSGTTSGTTTGTSTDTSTDTSGTTTGTSTDTSTDTGTDTSGTTEGTVSGTTTDTG